MKVKVGLLRHLEEAGASIWHVIRADGMTVCGRKISAGARRMLTTDRAKSKTRRKLCKSCDRMKGAEGMRLA